MKLILNSHHPVICYELLIAINNVSKGSQKQEELKLGGKKTFYYHNLTIHLNCKSLFFQQTFSKWKHLFQLLQ